MSKKKTGKKRRGGSRSGTGTGTGTGKPIAIYHDMAVYEDFERAAQRIFLMVRSARLRFPGTPRILYLDVQGHRNAAGGYDGDALELMQEFTLGYLMPFLTEARTPLLHVANPRPQRDDLPQALLIGPPEDGTSHEYDHAGLPLRPREHAPADRRSPPGVKAIAEYLGMSEACCLICWATPVERAHVVPASLGGSMDVRNFALLCREHHQEAPDVADAESFWAWVDYAELRDGGSKWLQASEEEQARLRALGVKVGLPPRPARTFFAEVKDELRRLYGWSDEDFAQADWPRLMEEFHVVLDTATGRHFSVDKKASTYAWAYDMARRRIAGEE
ncbi:HNH endonuclease [Streptomyces flavotricini]|uniref:HNH endonuclease n=1 Tax=Streptomyces flavotricini TaxID=66888 RepID=UPI001E504E98|nr:HNH endonuclease signature motif containing protein [Streptomyces flavotricini]